MSRSGLAFPSSNGEIMPPLPLTSLSPTPPPPALRSVSHPPTPLISMWASLPLSPSSPTYTLLSPNTSPPSSSTLASIHSFTYPSQPPPPTPLITPTNNSCFVLTDSTSLRSYGYTRQYHSTPLYLSSHPYLNYHADLRRRLPSPTVCCTRSLILLSPVAGCASFFNVLLNTIDAVVKRVEWEVMQSDAKDASNEKREEVYKAMLLERVGFILDSLNKQAMSGNDTGSVTILKGLEHGLTSTLSTLSNCNHRLSLPFSLQGGDGGLSSPMSTPLLPLLRTLGVPNTLRLLAALLCERRLIFTSTSLPLLSACIHAALALLTPHLQWHHVFVPALPQQFLTYACAPMPFIIGIPAQHLALLDHQPVGEAVYVDLDKGGLQLSGGVKDVHFVPDLLMNVGSPPGEEDGDSARNNVGLVLYQELADVLKSDKRARDGGEKEGVMAGVSAVGAKAKGLMKFINKTVRNSGNSGYVVNEQDKEGEGESIYGEEEEGGGGDMWDFVNEQDEEKIRLALLAFFVYLLGDPRMYVTRENGEGGKQTMVCDKNMFIQKRARFGDSPGLTAIIAQFVHTQMFEQFVAHRIHVLSGSSPAATKTDVIKASEILFHNRHSFLPTEIKKTVQSNFSSTTPPKDDPVFIWRSKTLSLTSNSAFKGNYDLALDQLNEACREINGPLQTVMRVLWQRLKDSKGMRWRHALLSLEIMLRLLLDGPLTAITEIGDGIDKIREFTKYSGGVGGQGKPVREEASKIWALLTDLGRLFAARNHRAGQRSTRKRFGSVATQRISFAAAASGGFKSMHQTVGGGSRGVLRGPCAYPPWAPIVKRRFGGLPVGTVLPAILVVETTVVEEGAKVVAEAKVVLSAPNLLDFGGEASKGGGGFDTAPVFDTAPAFDAAPAFDDNAWSASSFDEDPFAQVTAGGGGGGGFAQFGEEQGASKVAIRKPSMEAVVAPAAFSAFQDFSEDPFGGGGEGDPFAGGGDPFAVVPSQQVPQQFQQQLPQQVQAPTLQPNVGFAISNLSVNSSTPAQGSNNQASGDPFADLAFM